MKFCLTSECVDAIQYNGLNGCDVIETFPNCGLSFSKDSNILLHQPLNQLIRAVSVPVNHWVLKHPKGRTVRIVSPATFIEDFSQVTVIKAP